MVQEDPRIDLEILQEVKAMERPEWLKQIREMTERLYDHVSPEYWDRFGLYENEAHQEYLRKFIGSVWCGSLRWDIA